MPFEVAQVVGRLRSSGQELDSQPGVAWMCSTDDDHAS